MKKIKLCFVSLGLTILLLCSSIFAINDFETTRTFQKGTFSDLDEDEWYYKEVVSAYETGLVNGMSENIFNPNGKVTVAQAITIVSRINSIYNQSSEAFAQGDVWYSVYVDYAKSKGIITDDTFDNFTRNIKRCEMAQILANSLPKEAFNAINNITSIPDVENNSDYYQSLILLYNSGIIMGNDEYGTFNPNSDIKRSELSAIVNRVTNPNNRLHKTLNTDNTRKMTPAVYLCDGNNIPTGTAYAQLGWDFDNRGGSMGGSSFVVNDISSKERSALIREITEQTTGIVTVEGLYSMLADNNKKNGFYIYLGDGEEKAAAKIFVKDEHYFVFDGKNEVDTGVVSKRGTVYFKLICNLDTKKFTVALNNVFSGPYSFSEDCVKINKFMYASSVEGIANVSPKYTRIYSGYALNDTFISTPTEVLPYDWTFTSNSAENIAAVKPNFSSKYDENGLDIIAKANTESVLTQKFVSMSAKTAFEMKFYIEKLKGSAEFTLTNGENDVLGFKIENGKFYDQSGNLLKAFTENLWNTLRIEANTKTGKAVLKINLKVVKEFDFYEKSFDGIKVKFNPTEESTLRLDDFYVFNMFDDEPDYVPQPIPCENNGYYVGSLVCDIWRNGYHFGWDYVAPFEEMTPYLGYYDEGSTEVSDWETKWMIEHGIDFRLACWYSGAVDTPLKTPRNSFGLNDGFLNSKYSNMHKYAIMWENSSNLPTTREKFRENILSYWIEYYLTDERYMTIDNKPVIAIYNYVNMIKLFEDAAGCKEELEYIREVCKSLGYDGAIILSSGGSAENEKLEILKSMGYDGVFAYNWGFGAYNPQLQIKSISDQNNKKIIDTVPTVAVGFNSIPLYGERFPNISLKDYEKVLTWVKDDFLAKRDPSTWQSKLLILSNWNEYGEGHYIIPSSLNGFGYLDTIRKVFSNDSKHNDVYPKVEQRTRFCNLYPQDRKLIRRLMWETEEVDTQKLIPKLTWDFSQEDTGKLWRNQFNVNDFEKTTTSVKGSSKQSDFAILLDKKIMFDSKSGNYFHVRMKNTMVSGEKDQRCQVFFITESDEKWNDAKCAFQNIIADGEYHDYYIDLSVSKAFDGQLIQFRFDPMMAPGSFEIEKMEIMSKSDVYEVSINGLKLEFDFTPVLNSEGQLLVSFNPYKKIALMLNSYSTWNNTKKELTIRANGHTIVFTIGKNTAIADGKEVNCGSTITLRDGLPIVPLNFICSVLGYEIINEGMENRVIAAQTDIAEIIKNRKNYEWEFEVENDTEGWTYASATLNGVSEGNMKFTSNSNGKRHDPALMSPDISLNAADYDKILVNMKYELAEVDSASATLFFKVVGTNLDEKKIIKLPLSEQSTNGEYKEFVFDMKSNELWNGIISMIRFDPFDAVGTFDIDYIRIIKN